MTQRDRVLKMLEDAGHAGVTNADFLRACLPRFSARLLELRASGYQISTDRVREGSWRYQLVGATPKPSTSRSAPEDQPSAPSDMPGIPSGKAWSETHHSVDALFDSTTPIQTRSGITGQPMPHRKENAA